VYVDVCVCIRTHTHTLHVGYSGVSPGRDETLGEPGKSRWTKSQDIHIHNCVRSIQVQPIPLGVIFSNAVSKLKAQSSNVSFH